jgi:Tfp pilus assembly protein PilX
MANNNTSKTRNKHNRGVALVTSLLLLSLFTVMTLSMVIATTSDTLIDGYYRNARGSFYAADSGINAVRQYMINQLSAAVPTSFTTFSTPITSANETAIMTAIGNSSSGFGAYQSAIGSQSSWPGKFQVVYNSACATTGGAGCPTYMTFPATCTVHYTSSTGTIPTCYAAGNGSATWYQLSYPYKITVSGMSQTNEASTIEEQGTIYLTVTISTSGSTTTNFAAYGMFIDQNTICNGSTLVPGTISGPVFTNGAWTFGTSGSYIFTDQVGSAGSNLGYQFSSSCAQTSAVSATSGSQTINPTFQSGVRLGQTAVPLPTDSFNQREAVLDSLGNGLITSSNLQAQLHAILKDSTGTAYPSSGTPSSGVFLPYYMNGSTPTFGSAPGVLPTGGTVADPYGSGAGCGGGILVEGNAQVAVTVGSTATQQVYTITQGSTVTTVTVDTAGSGSTTIKRGSAAALTVAGVPQQCDPTTGTATRAATMLYVDGNVTGLQGGGQGVGSIQDVTALSVAASGSVTITGDLLYVHEPVTQAQSGSTPADTLIPANNHGQSLGIFTANGNINLANSQSNGNLEIDASIAAISNGGSGGLVNTGSAIGTLTIVGGRIQNTIQNINTSTRNVWFDRRYAQGGFAPPWFPATTVTTTTTFTSPTPVVTANRISWVNTSAQ